MLLLANMRQAGRMDSMAEHMRKGGPDVYG